MLLHPIPLTLFTVLLLTAFIFVAYATKEKRIKDHR